jgi:tetratricopeptide (TPR) repeat protein
MMRGASLWVAVAVGALAGCAQMPGERAPALEPLVSAPPAPPMSRTISEAVTRHRRLADSARQSGDLAAVAVQLQILTVLAPDDAAYKRELAATRAAIDKEAREQIAAGNAALTAGDLDRASTAMLRALALDPSQPDAAKALREIDRRRLIRIQADRAAKVRIEDTVAIRGAARAQAAENNDAFDVEQAIEMLRAGDSAGGLRDLKAFVDANPGNRAARQRIGTAVADRARELEDQGAREQAVTLYDQAIVLLGNANAPWATRVPPLKKTLSQEYFDKGTRAYRTNLAQAITFFETSVRYDPSNAQANLKLKEAKAVREKLDKIK